MSGGKSEKGLQRARKEPAPFCKRSDERFCSRAAAMTNGSRETQSASGHASALPPFSMLLLPDDQAAAVVFVFAPLFRSSSSSCTLLCLSLFHDLFPAARSPPGILSARAREGGRTRGREQAKEIEKKSPWTPRIDGHRRRRHLPISFSLSPSPLTTCASAAISIDYRPVV